MNFFVKASTKNIILSLLGLFFLFIILSNILANTEGMESGEESQSSPEITPPAMGKKKTSAKLQEDEEQPDSIEDDSY